MNLIYRLIELLGGRRKAYYIELPIGNEISDIDRAAIYGWPDFSVRDVTDESDLYDTGE